MQSGLDQKYTPYYCEENIYKLIEHLSIQPVSPGTIVQNYAVFITNPFKQTFIRQQRIGDPKQQHAVQWDYHVIMVQKLTTSEEIDGKKRISSRSIVYDYDTILGLSSPFEKYFERALKDPPVATWYRVVPSQKFLEEFASDRSHMVAKRTPKGQIIYHKPPPQWTNIRGGKAQSHHNLDEYLDCGNKTLGLWMQQETLLEYFSAKTT